MYETMASRLHAQVSAVLLLLGLGGCANAARSEDTVEPAAQYAREETTKKPPGSPDYQVENGGVGCEGKSVKRVKYDKGVHFSFGTYTARPEAAAGGVRGNCWLSISIPPVPGWQATVRRIGAMGSAYLPQGSGTSYLLGANDWDVPLRAFELKGEHRGGWVRTARIREKLNDCGRGNEYNVGLSAHTSGDASASFTVTDLLVEVVWIRCGS